ncbi:teleost multiple tissue opsin 2b isoform X3 [Electrophorus electricus]|uniref:teleost multiple tissue opsin 2b isoform X3 n=1 Tax=Electrophorus electricus TaxID=8005 RepID=UPI0015CFDEED|nr:teleost multiple tissue opsin 2b isoform X3 [Electrophorus electricus]
MMSFQTSHLNDTFSVSDKDPVRFLHEQWNDSPTGTLSRAGLVALSVFLGLIMTSGFLNNVVVLALFCKFKTLRTPVNVILVNISLSDLLVCACGTTLSFASSVRGRWFLGKQACMWHGFVNSCFGIVSLISLVILSYERYRTLTVYNQKSLGYRKPLLAVGGSWLYSLIWTVPPLLGWSSYGLEGAGTSCSVSWTERSPKSSAYIVCLFIFCLGLPVTVMVYSYGRLFYAVKQTWTPDKILQTICSAVSVCYFTVVTDGKTGDFGIPLFLHQSWKGAEVSISEEGVPPVVHGDRHGDVLPAVLDTVRHRGLNRYVWPARSRIPAGERGTFSPC